MTDWTKRVGGTLRSEACVVEKTIFGEDAKYIRHRFTQDKQFTYYKAVCQRCKHVSFIKPQRFFFWRPKTDDEMQLAEEQNQKIQKEHEVIQQWEKI